MGDLRRLRYPGGFVRNALRGLLASLCTLAMAAPATAQQPAAGRSPREIDRVWAPVGGGIRENQITAVALDPRDPRRVLAGTARGAIYRSIDRGVTWEETLRIPFGSGVDGELDLDDDDEDLLEEGLRQEDLDELDELRERVRLETIDELTEEVGEDEAERIAEEEAEEAVEERRAELLQEASEREQAREEAEESVLDEQSDVPPVRQGAVRKIVWDPSFAGLVYLATRDGIWRSGDGGETWVQLDGLVGEQDLDVIDVAPSAGGPDRILAGTAGGLLVSDDGGVNWSRASGEVGTVEVRALALDPERRAVVVAGTVNGAFVTTNGGEEWQKVFSETGRSGDVRAVEIVPGTNRIILGTENGLHLITPGGKTPIGVAAFASPIIRGLVVPRGDISRLYVATARGVHESTDGGETFVELFEGLRTTNIFVIAEDPRTPLGLWAGSGLGVFRLEPARPLLESYRPPGASMSELVLAADRYGPVDGDRLRAWRRQARYTHLLPRLQFRWKSDFASDRQQDFEVLQDANGTILGTVPVQYRFDEDRRSGWLVMFTWQFDELFAGSRLTRLQSQVRPLIRQRNRRVAKVATLARERSEVAARLAAVPAEEVAERVSLELRLQEITGYIDAATGGAASKGMQRSQQEER